MFQSYLKVAFRNLIKNKGYTLINITGIAVGFACCLLIGLYVQSELSFDKYHEHHPNLFRLANHVEGGSYANGIAKVSDPWGPEAKKTIPEVEEMCRFVFYGQALVKYEDELNYEGGGLYADPSVFKMFSWNLLEGDPETALSEPNSIVLTKRLADKYFQNENPIGKTLNFDNQIDRKVTAVLEDVPLNSHFRFRYLAPLEDHTHPDRGKWSHWNQFYTYLQLEERADIKMVETKLDAMLAQHLEEDLSDAWTPFLQPITDIHLTSNLHREMAANSDINYIYIFSLIALFILIIACTNIVNLSTARATHRAKEVGVRKVTGASKGILIRQFIGESMLVCVFAAVLAIMLAELMLKPMNAILGSQLDLNLMENMELTAGLVIVTFLTSLISGGYPAFILSNFRPANVLKGNLNFTGNSGLRRGLVIFQFAIATFLIIGTLVVNNQLHYIQNKNLGFNKDQIINVPMQAATTNQKAATIKDKLLKIPGVLKVSTSANRPGGSDYGVPAKAVGVPDDQQPSMRCLVIDEDFLDTYEMEIAQGRGFSKEMSTDTAAYLINETAAKQLGWDNIEGKQIEMPAVGRAAGSVVGVVKDFHFRSMHEKIAPLYFFVEPTWFSQFSIKIDASKLNETLAVLEQKWQELEPGYPFAYRFFDQSYGSLHAAEQSTASIIKWFTFLAIFITCLGLFGLSTYTAESRTKEIGIRKVLGASVGNIIGMMSKEVLILVGMAIVVAAPLAFWASSNWLQSYAYTMDLSANTFIYAGILAILIALFTVSYHSIRSALTNPIESLRYE